MVDNPHDRLFKVTLSQPGAARAYLRSVLPAALCAALDFEHMEAQPTDLVGTRLQELFADVVYKIPLEGESAYVCALLEHQSTPEPMMPLRFMNAMASIWEDVLRAEPERRRVPAIIPVLVHNGAKPWRSPVRLSELYDLPAAVLDMLEPNLPEFEYVLDDLRVQDEEVRFLLVEVEGATTTPHHAGAIETPLRIVSWYDAIEIHRPGRVPLTFSGVGARILAELIAIEGPADWHVVASEVWRETSASPELRHRWDVSGGRVRARLKAAGVRDLVRSDGSGLVQLVRGPDDVIEDRS